jgi:WD40 repeat protein
MAFSPDGQKLASMDEIQSTIRIWDLRTGEQIGQIEPARPYEQGGWGTGPSLLAFSPGGELLAAACRGDSSVRLWDVKAHRLLHTVPIPTTNRHHLPKAIAFSPDGRRLAVGGGYEGPIHIIDTVKGELVARWGDLPFVALLAFSPDGKTLLSINFSPRSDRNFNITFNQWDVETGRKRGENVFAQDESCRNGDLSPDGKLFAMPLKGGTVIQLIDPRTGKELRRTEGKTIRAYQITFSGDGRFLTAICDDGIVHVWESATGKIAHRFRGLPSSIDRVALSHKGDRLALVGRADWAVHVWDLARERELHDFPGHRGGILSVAFSADGKTIATTSRDGGRRTPILDWGDWSLRRWDAATGEERAVTRRDLGGEVPVTAFSPDGRLLATVRHDGTLYLWDVATGEELRRWKVPVQEGTYRSGALTAKTWSLYIEQLAFTHDGKIVLATDGEMIYRWETATGKELPAWELGSRHYFVSCAISPDDRLLVVNREARRGLRLTLIDLKSGGELWHLPGVGNAAGRLVFSPDGRTLAVADRAAVHLLEVESRQVRGHVACSLPARTGPVFSPDGRLLACGRYTDGRVQLWDLASGQVVRELDANAPHDSLSLAFSPDGSRLASAGYENTVRVWDVSDLRKGSAAAAPRLSPDELESLWLDLAGAYADRAYRAIWKLATAPRQGVPFLKRRMTAPPTPDEKRLPKLIGELDDDRFPVREKASRELENLGPKAESALREELARKPSTEARRRIEHLLEKLGGKDAPPLPSRELIALRVLEALERSESPEAREVIGEIARGTPDSRLTREAKASLRRLEKRSVIKP